MLLALATQAAVSHFSPMPADLEASPRAFWLAENCMPRLEVTDNAGNVHSSEKPQGDDMSEQESLANQDVRQFLVIS